MYIKRIHPENGTTLIEVLLATVMTICIVVTISLAFPVASRNVLQSRQKLEATHLASSQTALLKSQPYSLVEAQSCDCNAPGLDFTPFIQKTSSNAGAEFKVAACVNYVTPGTGNTWTATCPANGDTGYKVILVRVFWSNGSSTNQVTQTCAMTRF